MLLGLVRYCAVWLDAVLLGLVNYGAIELITVLPGLWLGSVQCNLAQNYKVMFLL